ncbi:putative protein OS=Bosea thiooxidans OX=53254 GN=SAMN05660750_04085 PE=4 SV=1 [Bosea thiooxidans]|uniref:Uncharacterized protein n=1 Tax=Bosea thiooxidans TaxID=53254 RepID=A0A1T5GII4_9HYPH|nr:hypothetical protein [Bosea thiooxidans]SKC08140.1 hypothetical protein SAMN05660750_04085 [Bosea thiooxidans]
MADVYEINRRLSGAYAVSAQTVERLGSVIEAAIGAPPKLKMEFTNNRNISSNSVADINDSYVEAACLDEVSFFAMNGNNACSLALGWSSSRPVYISITLPRSQAKDLEENIVNILSANETWYHWFFKLKQTSLSFNAFLGLITIFVVSLAMAFNFADYVIKNPYLVGAFKIFLVIAIANVVTDLTLPSMSFNIGKSGRRIRFKRNLFNFIILVVLVGVGINLLSDIVKPYVLPPSG